MKEVYELTTEDKLKAATKVYLKKRDSAEIEGKNFTNFSKTTRVQPKDRLVCTKPQLSQLLCSYLHRSETSSLPSRGETESFSSTDGLKKVKVEALGKSKKIGSFPAADLYLVSC